MKERVEAGRLVRPDALHQRSGSRRRFAESFRIQPCLWQALANDRLFVGAIGIPQLRTIGHGRPALGRQASCP
jgi:hypothetical protein